MYIVNRQLQLKGNLSENWKRFKQSFGIYLLASVLCKSDNDRKIVTLLNLIGAEDTLEVYYPFQKTSESKTNDNVIKLF